MCPFSYSGRRCWDVVRSARSPLGQGGDKEWEVPVKDKEKETGK